MSSSTAKSSRGLRVPHPCAAGIDIGSERHYVAVDISLDADPVRTFGCTTAELHEMGRWLKSCAVTTVAMESTGVYWVPVARILEEDFGLEVYLVDAKQAKAVPGRKSDVKDCQWLQELHRYGLLSRAYRPKSEIEPLKAYHRHRKSLVEACAQQVHRMQKALEVMNVQLHKVLSDITGVTGMAIVRAIVAGERDGAKLAQHRQRSVKRSVEEIAEALQGNFLPEQVFLLTQALAAYDFTHTQIATCDAQIESYMATLAKRSAAEAVPDDVGAVEVATSDAMREKSAPKIRRRKNQAHFDLRSELKRICGVDLTLIPGIDALTAFTVVAEVGVDVSAFPSEKHFASWLALSPNHVITGGRVRRRQTRPGASRVATALRVSAQTLHRSKTALGASYRRLRARLGPPKAITAAARRLAVLAYRMLKYGEAYVEKGQEWEDARYKERARAKLLSDAKRLGFALVPMEVS